jgi:hypothetical protein
VIPVHPGGDPTSLANVLEVSLAGPGCTEPIWPRRIGSVHPIPAAAAFKGKGS